MDAAPSSHEDELIRARVFTPSGHVVAACAKADMLGAPDTFEMTT